MSSGPFLLFFLFTSETSETFSYNFGSYLHWIILQNDSRQGGWMVYYRHARWHINVQKVLDEESNLGHKLKSVTMGDLGTRYDMYFEDSSSKYIYVHEHCRIPNKVTYLINQYENNGYKLIFHVMGDLNTRHELFFEKEI